MAKSFRKTIRHLIKAHFPYLWVKHKYFTTIGKKLCIADPRDINEKIIWLEYFTDTREWTTFADKYAVRDLVRDKLGEEVLIPLLGMWKHIEDIDFSILPEKFVIKLNNGSNDVIIVREKGKTDLEFVRKQLYKSLHKNFGMETGEWHYLRIKPCIIAEKLLEVDDVRGLVDYKIWCFGGKPHSILLCSNRDKQIHKVDLNYYDLDWNRHPEKMAPEVRNNLEYPKPDNFDLMLEYASKLSAGLPEARVDFYNINGKIYFGELTLSSYRGMMYYYTQETLNEMGALCVLPDRSWKEKVKMMFFRYLPQF